MVGARSMYLAFQPYGPIIQRVDENELRCKILAEIEAVRRIEAEQSKVLSRSVHAPSVQIEREKSRKWIEGKYPKLSQWFANGEDIDPARIDPHLVEVAEPWHSDLFRLARLTWSLPYNKGYGRRLRFLIIDSNHEKLIAILGLQSPPLDFPVRDELFAYPEGRKVEFVNQTMDVYALGALPPYSHLLGGKLAALAVSSDEVRMIYRNKYRGRTTEMEDQVLPARLVALTTTSAFGRSSLYNRLRFKTELVAESIGYTKGYGSFHLAGLYPEIINYLESRGFEGKYGGFGVGPRVVWQTFTRAFNMLGLPRGLLRHGVKREAFLFPLVRNLKSYLEGKNKTPLYHKRSFSELSDWWKARWLHRRATHTVDWRSWDKSELKNDLLGVNHASTSHKR